MNCVRARTPHLVALVAGVCGVAVLHAVKASALSRIEVWINQPVYLTQEQRNFIVLVKSWDAYWWVYDAFVIGLCLVCSSLYVSLLKDRNV